MVRKTNSTLPLISVVMPVYNAASYLESAINSIQKQTGVNWELIIIDDASTDGSYNLAKKFAVSNNKIRVFKNKQNLGVATTANKAIKKAKGQYIARMDADDIALPSRLQKQIAYLLKNPRAVAVGAQCHVINKKGKKIGKKVFPVSTAQIKRMMFRFYPLQQPTLMVNTKLLPKNFVWYQEGLTAAEEHELLYKFLEIGDVVNLPDFLLEYRVHTNSATWKHPKKDFFYILKTRIKGIFQYGYRPTIKDVLTNFAQLITMLFLPEKLIFPIYAQIRGISK